MDRINGADWVDIGGGRQGFRDQNKAAGIAGTVVTDDWLNAVQEELLKVIEDAGLVPNNGNWTQLAEAIGLKIAAGVITEDVTYDINAAGDGDFVDINAAMAYLAAKQIAANATVTLQLDAGTHAYTADIVIDHPRAHRIAIVGAAMAGANPARGDLAVTGHDAPARAVDAANHKTTLQADFATEIAFTGAYGMKVTGCHLGQLTDIMLIGDGLAATGLKVEDGGVSFSGAFAAHGFGLDGVGASRSSVNAGGAVIVASGNGSSGFALHTSFIYGAPKVIAASNADAGLNGEGAQFYLGQVTLLGHGNSGARIDTSTLHTSDLQVSVAGGDALVIQEGSFMTAAIVGVTNAAGRGVYVSSSEAKISDGYATSNTGNPLEAINRAMVVWTSASIGGPSAFDAVASHGAHIRLPSVEGTVALSPAADTVGNYNAFITKN